MKINTKQKNIIIGGLILFIISVIYVPCQLTVNGNAFFQSYNFLWEIGGEIAFKVLLVEWVGIAVVFMGLYTINGIDES